MVYRLAANELGRFMARNLPRLALLALLIIPLLYSSLYLYANSDPYANLKNVPVAIVNLDEGAATNADSGLPANMGAELVAKLKDNDSFDWQEATAGDVTLKVVEGDYAFALVIGEDFTKNIDQLSQFDAVQTEMQLILNDANSYVLHEIAEQMKNTVAAEVAGEIGRQVIVLQLQGLVQIRAQLEEAAKGAGELSSGLQEALDGSRDLATGAELFAGGLADLRNGIGQLNNAVQALPRGVAQLKSGASQLAAGLDQVDAVTQEVAGVEGRLNQVWHEISADLRALINASGLPEPVKQDLLRELAAADDVVAQIHAAVTQYASAIDQLDVGARQLDAGIGQLEQSAGQLVAGIEQLNAGAVELDTRFGEIVTGIGTLSSGLEQLTAGATELEEGLADGAAQLPDLTDKQRERFAQVVMNPVEFKTSTIAPARSYAIGLAPFFMALAGWIGVYILFVLVPPFSTRALIANVAPWKVTLGGWLPLALIGVGQMLVMLVALHFIVDLTPVHLALTVGFLCLMVLTYLTIVHCLVAGLGKAGLFLGLVLMVVQLTTSGGTFPWQTLPAIDQPLHHLLPMGHAVDALRNLMYGGSLDMAGRHSLVLVAYLVAFAAADVAAIRLRRRWSMHLLLPAI